MKTVILVVDEKGHPDEQFEPIELDEDGDEGVREAIERFLEKANEEGWGSWDDDRHGYINTKFEPIRAGEAGEAGEAGVFEAEIEYHQVSSARFFFKIIENKE